MIDAQKLQAALSALGAAFQPAAVDSKAAVWRELRISDEEIRPYTPAAIKLLEALHERDTQDIDLVHRLAIAWHALAWDLELANEPSAPEAWMKAFEYWRRLQSSSAFWAALKARGAELGANEAIIDEFRKHLLGYLIQIHIDFIKTFPHKAESHIQLVQRAPISPALRNLLPQMVYDAMTTTLPLLRSQQKLEDALSLIERYLTFFPVYLEALRMVLDIVQEIILPLSPADNAQRLVEMSKRVDPYWQQITAQPNLAQADPLAKLASEQIALNFTRKLFVAWKSLENTDPNLSSESFDNGRLWSSRLEPTAEE